jgi:hypothetical protein
MQYRRNIAFAALTVAIGLVAPRAEALAQSGACKMGARVTDRENRTGTVVEATGADCRVKLADGTVRYYLAWMLTAAGGDSAKPTDGAPGSRWAPTPAWRPVAPLARSGS